MGKSPLQSLNFNYLGTTDQYISQLKSMPNTKKHMEKGKNSVFTEYDDKNGVFKGSIYQENKLTAIKIGNVAYFDYDGDHQIDKKIEFEKDGTEIITDKNGKRIYMQGIHK